jgi:hypothetical protein
MLERPARSRYPVRVGKQKPIWLVAALAIAFLAIGIPNWRIPYNQFDLSHIELLPGAIFMAIATMALIGAQTVPARWVIGAMLICAPLIDLVAIVHDTSIDATTHNMAPFELIAAAVLGAGFVLPGAAIGLVIRARRR